ncbi:unnamed protein product [Boreogadus saida]
MEGHCYDRTWDGERDNYQIDYRRIVGDTEPARPRLSPRDGEQPAPPYGPYAHHTSPHSIGHETAAQRYSATRIQAGYEPERSVWARSAGYEPERSVWAWSAGYEPERSVWARSAGYEPERPTAGWGCPIRRLGMSHQEAGDVPSGGWGCPIRRLGMSHQEAGDVPSGGWGCPIRRLGMSHQEAGDVPSGGWGCFNFVTLTFVVGF